MLKLQLLFVIVLLYSAATISAYDICHKEYFHATGGQRICEKLCPPASPKERCTNVVISSQVGICPSNCCNVRGNCRYTTPADGF